MGMNFNLVRVDQDKLDKFKEEPHLFEKYVRNEFCTDEELDSLSDEEWEKRFENVVHLDKYWEGINYILTHIQLYRLVLFK